MLLLKDKAALELPSTDNTKRDPLGLTPLPADNRQRFLRFMLSQQNDALLPLKKILEVMQLPIEDIFPVPDMSGCILGVCSWQGETLWLVDLNHLVGYSPLCQQSQLLDPPFVVVIQHNKKTIGLVVEQVSDVDLFDEASIHMEPGLCPAGLEPFVMGYCPHQGGTVLNVSAIINTPLLHPHR